MHRLIEQAFEHIENLGPHVREGHYDLEGPEGELILKEIWETTVQPGWQVTMKMWPTQNHPLRRNTGPMPFMPGNMSQEQRRFAEAMRNRAFQQHGAPRVVPPAPMHHPGSMPIPPPGFAPAPMQNPHIHIVDPMGREKRHKKEEKPRGTSFRGWVVGKPPARKSSKK